LILRKVAQHISDFTSVPMPGGRGQTNRVSALWSGPGSSDHRTRRENALGGASLRDGSGIAQSSSGRR
jgi:hypothetical protein